MLLDAFGVLWVQKKDLILNKIKKNINLQKNVMKKTECLYSMIHFRSYSLNIIYNIYILPKFIQP